MCVCAFVAAGLYWLVDGADGNHTQCKRKHRQTKRPPYQRQTYHRRSFQTHTHFGESNAQSCMVVSRTHFKWGGWKSGKRDHMTDARARDCVCVFCHQNQMPPLGKMHTHMSVYTFALHWYTVHFMRFVCAHDSRRFAAAIVVVVVVIVVQHMGFMHFHVCSRESAAAVAAAAAAATERHRKSCAASPTLTCEQYASACAPCLNRLRCSRFPRRIRPN